MKYGNYFQPDTLIPGKRYYIKTANPDTPTKLQPVDFIDYRPHPGEVLVRDGSRAIVIHRVWLFQKNGGK